MAGTKSFQRYATIPSAIISDGVLTIPLWAVSTMSISETYHLPAIGSAGSRAIVSAHDDTISMSGLLVGAERYAWKVGLETLAEASRRGSAIQGMTGGKVSGLILVTAMTIRTDMQVQSLSFSASAAKRDVIDVTISMAHMPLPGGLGKLLDLASVGIGGLADLGGS